MSIVREARVKKLMLSVLLTFLLTLFLTLTVISRQNHAAWQLLLNRERAIAASLLEQEVPEELVARALSAAEAGEEGIRPLNRNLREYGPVASFLRILLQAGYFSFSPLHPPAFFLHSVPHNDSFSI